MAEYVLYRFTHNESQKCYFGITGNLAARVRQHRHRAFTEQKHHPFYAALRKHGIEAFTLEVIARTDDRDLIAELERLSITAAFGRCYNLAEGGSINRGFRKTAEQRAAHSATMRAKYEDPAFREKNRLTSVAAMLAEKASNPDVEARRLAGVRSEKNRARLSVNARQQFASVEGRIASARGRSRHRYVTPGGVFESLMEAVAFHRVSNVTVLNRCKNSGAKWAGWSFEPKR